MAIKPYRYSYTMPKGKKRFKGIAHGNSWGEAKAQIKRYHPKRSNIRREGIFGF